MSELNDWLEQFGLEQLASTLLENDVDLDVLADLDESDLEKLGLSMGQRKRLLRAIASLSASQNESSLPLPVPNPTSFTPGSIAAEPGERRQLTVMFCDLVGSTAMSARFDPEELRDILRRYRDATHDAITHLGGHIARYLGDGILVYFGYPRADEYDAERAIRAGLQIVEVVSRLDVHPEVTLQVRIGIATGLVVVGDIVGMDQMEEDAVVGETPNLAARLQEHSEPNQVVVSPSTRALALAPFQYASKGRHLLKGFPEPVEVWAVEGSSDVVTRFQASHTAGASPLVGRDSEIDWLRVCWSKVTAGRGQAVLLTGEAGFGKSRLAHSFSQETASTGCQRLELQCSPYHSNTAYYPLIAALSRAAALQPDDTSEIRQQKIGTMIAQCGDDSERSRTAVTRLLSADGWQQEEAEPRNPERLKEDTFEALLALMIGRSAQLPLLVLLEDAHWIDPTTWEFLERLTERISAERVLLLVTSRPDGSRRLPRHEYVTHIELKRLSTDSASAVVSAILGGKSLPEEVRSQILAKTDGVPLFVEELTKMVVESNLLRDAGDRYELTDTLPDLAIPATLQDSLMARLDRLEPVKEVAQVGAVLGREFDYELLEQVVTNIDREELDSALEKLADAELLFASGRPPRARYTFKHALVQDAAYSTMLHRKRRALHARVADVMEKHFPERAFLEPELMARHCEHGGLTERAIKHWCVAGHRALERSAITESLSHVDKGLTLLEQTPDSIPGSELELELQTLRGWASIAAHGYTAPQTGNALTRARHLCDVVGDTPHLFSVLHGQWLFHLLQAQVGVAREIASEMLSAAERSDDTSSLVTAHRVQGTTAFWLGTFESARVHLERALEMFRSHPVRPADVTGMFDVRVVGLDFLSLTLLPLGFTESAHQHNEQAVTEAQSSGALVTLAVVLQHSCLFHQLVGDRRKVLLRAEQLHELSQREGYPFWHAHARFFEAWASFDAQDRKSVRRVAAARDAVISTGSQLFFPYYSALLAELCGTVGDTERSMELFDVALGSIESSQERWFEAEVHRMKGEQRARAFPGQRDAALADLRNAERVAYEQAARAWEARAQDSISKLMQ